jgi:hypothetical protein
MKTLDFCLLVVVAFVFMVLAGCTPAVAGPAGTPTPAPTDVAPEPDNALMIRSVQVDGGQIIVSGRSTLPDGMCILTELRAGGQAQAWWPAETCATVQQGDWQISVRLGQGNTPAQLAVTPMYEVRAWQQGQPSTSVVFPFDLAGPPTPPPVQEVVFQPMSIPEAGLTVQVPSGWQQTASAWAWSPDESGRTIVGVAWMDLEPPVIPEAAMLPKGAQILDSEEVTLGWGNGRRFLLEVYAEDAQATGGKAPVQAVELHTLVVVELDGARRAFDLYASAPTASELDALKPVLRHMLDTSALAEAGQSTTPANHVQPEGWQIYEDDTYGFAFSYPPDWTVRELLVDGPGMPGDWPIAQTVQVLPNEWAEQLDRGGPPDPTRPSVVAPLHVEVCVGSPEQYRRVYPAPDQSEEMTVNGIAVSVERNVLSDQITQIRYVFLSPLDGELRVVLNDMLTGFSERVQENEAVAEAIPLIVATFGFTE